MKKLGSMFLFSLALVFSAWPLAAQKSANPGYEKLKTLVGEWEGKTGDGTRIQVSYQLVSNGTALLETLQPSDKETMLTLYVPDGARVAVTHYCSAGNQPRMRTAVIAATPAKLDFSFVGGTNLTSSAGHMRKLVVTFEDSNHFAQTWTWREKGQIKPSETFRFARKSTS